MQKKLIALAIAGFAAAPAFAQVTVYGVADATVDVVKASGATNAANDVGRFSRVSTNSSLLGFKGSEDLGNGLTAVFQFEGAVGFDSAAGYSFARDSFVGLSSASAGKVLIGNLTGPTRALGASMDVFAGATGIGMNGALLGKLGNNILGANGANSDIPFTTTCTRSSTCASTFDSRWKNALAYVSPSLGGVTLSAVYVANENRTRNGLNGTGSQVDTKGYDVGAVYAVGPLSVGLTRNWATIGDIDDTEAADTRIAGKYDFGVATVRAIYDMVKAEDNTGFELEQNVFGIGATVNVGAGRIVGQYYKADDLELNGVKVAETGASHIALGYEHPLTKRTMLKATYSRVSNDNNATYDFGVNATGVSSAGAAVSGFSAGVRHTF